jgi:hypothetical protein
VSFLSISLNFLVGGLSVSVSLLSIFGALGAGWAFGLASDLVCGLLPFVWINAVLVVRLWRNIGGVRLHKKDEKGRLEGGG